MTLSHRSRRSSSSSARGSTSSTQDAPSESDGAGQEVLEVFLRGSAELPPPIPNEADRQLIVPEGKTQWIQLPRPMGRTPSSVLTCLLKRHYPGLVEFRGKPIPASTWKHYQAAKDNAGRSKADIVEEDFWLRFRFEPTREAKSRQHVGKCCGPLISSILYYARIYAIIDHFRNVEGRIICDKIARTFYLSQQEYIDQRQVWCKVDCWRTLAAGWSHPNFIKKSEMNRANRQSRKFKPHKGGSNSIAAIRQKLSIKEGREVSQVEAWVYTHRGPDAEDPNSLNTEEAAACLERYKAKAIELNGQNFDWLHSPVDVRALHACSCGRPHGKWAIFNGIVDDREALAELKSADAPSLVAAKRQRREENEREANESRLAKEYAQNMLEWGRIVQMQNESIQKFMESVAAHTGMSRGAVPPPLPPPPPPPVYASTSPEKAGTFGSGTGAETPEETLSRIARGVYGGPVTGTTSGGSNYSPPQVDEFPLY